MAQLSHLMLFDPDPSGLDILTFGFEKEGCTVEGTADPVKAWQLVQRPVRALLVVILKASDPSGINLIRATTSNPKTRNLACVAIGREDARAAALAAGAFVFLSVPVFVRDIINVCRLVAAATVPGSRPSPKTEISLKLAEMAGVYFLMRALLVAGRSAAVEIRREGRRGELRFIDGSLSSAQLGSLEGLPALHRMLLWDDAGLTFKFKNVARRGTQLSMKSSEVTEECDRFLRDFAHEANDLGCGRTVYASNMKNLQPSTAFPSEVLPLLRLFDGRRDLSHVLEESPFRIFDTLKIVKRFVTDQAIRATTPLPPGRETAALVGPGALDVWLQRQAPALGVEMGQPMEMTAGAPAPLTPSAPPPPTLGGLPEEAGARAVVIPGTRPSSPFVAVAHDQGPPSIPTDHPLVATAPTQFVDKFEETAHGIRKTNFEEVFDGNGVPVRRPRTITQRERTLHVPGLVLPPGPHTMLTPPLVAPAVSTPPAVTPPPVAGLLPTLQVAAPALAKQGGVVARGEIRIAALTPPAMLAVPAVAASVVIDMDPPPPAALPAARPLVSNAPIPVTAMAQVVRLPSVIVAPMTPPPVLIAPPQVAVAPPQVAVAPPQVAIASPQVAVMSLPVAVAPPPTSERPRNGTPASGVSAEARRAARSPSDNFDAIESDFFDREADLYKRESVESFEDLDGAARARHPNGSGPTRKP